MAHRQHQEILAQHEQQKAELSSKVQDVEQSCSADAAQQREAHEQLRQQAEAHEQAAAQAKEAEKRLESELAEQRDALAAAEQRIAEKARELEEKADALRAADKEAASLKEAADQAAALESSTKLVQEELNRLREASAAKEAEHKAELAAARQNLNLGPWFEAATANARTAANESFHSLGVWSLTTWEWGKIKLANATAEVRERVGPLAGDAIRKTAEQLQAARAAVKPLEDLVEEKLDEYQVREKAGEAWNQGVDKVMEGRMHAIGAATEKAGLRADQATVVVDNVGRGILAVIVLLLALLSWRVVASVARCLCVCCLCSGRGKAKSAAASAILRKGLGARQ